MQLYKAFPLYVSQQSSSSISVLDSSGSPLASISIPSPGADGIAFDSHGNLYYADTTNNIIFKIPIPVNTSAPEIFVSNTPTYSYLEAPVGIAFDSSNNLYVSNVGSGTITRYNISGQLIDNPYYFLGLNGPVYISFDSSENLYVACFGNNQIFRITSLGTGAAITITNPSLNFPTGLAFDADGNLYVSNPAGNNVVKLVLIDPTGNTTWVQNPYYVGAGTQTSPDLVFPEGMVFDALGNLYVANEGSTNIIKITGVNTGTVFASGFSSPTDLAFSHAPQTYTITASSLRTIITQILINGLNNISAILSAVTLNPGNVALSTLELTDTIQATLDPCNECDAELIHNFALFQEAVSSITPNAQLVLASDCCCDGK